MNVKATNKVETNRYELELEVSQKSLTKPLTPFISGKARR